MTVNIVQDLQSHWKLRKEIEKMKEPKEGTPKSVIETPLKSLADFYSALAEEDCKEPPRKQQLGKLSEMSRIIWHSPLWSRKT